MIPIRDIKKLIAAGFRVIRRGIGGDTSVREYRQDQVLTRPWDPPTWSWRLMAKYETKADMKRAMDVLLQDSKTIEDF